MKRLTLDDIRAMQPGERIGDHQPATRGLEIRRRASGWYWAFYYRNGDGEQRRPSLGEWPVVPLEVARELARDMARRVARGEDPSEAKQERRAADTVQGLACRYALEVVAPRPYSPGHLETIESALRLYILPALGKARVNDVSLGDANACLLAVRGDTMRNRVRAVGSKLFGYAEQIGARTRSPDVDPRVNVNPFRGAVRGVERKRKRHVTEGEFGRLSVQFRRLAAEKPAHAAALLVLLMTGGRKTEVVAARRAQLIGNALILEDHKTAAHTGEDRTIRLPRQAMQVIASLPVPIDGSLWGPTVTKQTIREAWETMRAAAGCPDLQLRDFRRTFASAAKSAGASLDAVGELLDHTDPKTTSRYAFLFDDARDALTQRTADTIEDRLGGLPLIEGGTPNE